MVKSFNLFLLFSLSILLLFSCSLKKKQDKKVTGKENGKNDSKSGRVVGNDESEFGKNDSKINEEEIDSSSTDANDIKESENVTKNLSRIYFDFNSFSLNDQSKEILAGNAEIIKKAKHTLLKVIGNCDERGSASYNLALGLQRANSIKKYLVELGVSDETLRIESMGEEQPLVEGSSDEAYAQNRRGEFEIQIMMQDTEVKEM